MDRFEFTNKEGKWDGTRIIVDKETGVQYLFAFSGYAGGMTLLADRDGKPLLADGYENKKEN
ncbi:MAG: hypothetical protein IJ446_04380 [Oscillospiraceae bacterium]|nr:hypothetical protein [Oscillospiraceae bacterium]